jgi:sugar transferase (PEP-CTERM/EpsH1 system associated)
VRILYLAHRIPYPPNKGEKIRTFHQIQQLAKNHTIHLFSFVDDPDELSYRSALRKYCASVEVVYRSHGATLFLAAAGFLRRLPFSVSLFYRKALAEKIIQKVATERFDCIIVSSSSMAQYACLVPNLPKILDFIDVDSEKWRLYAQLRSFPLASVYQLEAERLARYEERIARVFDHSILSSEAEWHLFRARVTERPVSIISNGVDLQYFSRSGIVATDTSQPTIIFTGVMDYFPNVDAARYFCRDIFPLVRRTMTDAHFYVVGRNPTPQVRELAKQTNVTVTGTVPDVRPYLARATVAVAPFRLARGVQNKVLESMAMGVPVVAFKGIAATEQDGIRVANDPRSFAQHVTTFLRGDATLRLRAARQARSYVERHHRWEDQGAKLERLLEEVVSANTAANSLRVKSAAFA